MALASDDVAILDQLIADLGRDPGYVSPAARAPEKAGTALLESTFLLGGSVDLLTQELVMLDAVLLAEGKDHANWSCLAGMVEDRPAGDARTAREDPSRSRGPGWPARSITPRRGRRSRPSTVPPASAQTALSLTRPPSVSVGG